MDIVVFLGPTLSVAAAREILHACYRPPAACGDVLQAARQHPRAIALIDGYFDQRPAVWPKEILWALQEGVAVFGAASMGALRAVELAPFGMRGVGKVYQAFAAGMLRDDDEVAVTHGPAEAGFRASSEAMVNIRATLGYAHHAGVLDIGQVARLQRQAKAMFYPDRTYHALLQTADWLPEGTATQLKEFLRKNRANVKRDDARQLLQELAHGAPAPQPENFELAYTTHFDQLWRRVQADDDSPGRIT